MKYLIVMLIFIAFFLKCRKRFYLIEHGNIIFKNLSENYNLESLMKDLIKQNVDDISKIEKAYRLFGGLRIVTSVPHVLIWNGKIDYNALVEARKTPIFIYNSLKEKSLHLNQILYAIYLNDKLYIVKL